MVDLITHLTTSYCDRDSISGFSLKFMTHKIILCSLKNPHEQFVELCLLPISLRRKLLSRCFLNLKLHFMVNFESIKHFMFVANERRAEKIALKCHTCNKNHAMSRVSKRESSNVDKWTCVWVKWIYHFWSDFSLSQVVINCFWRNYVISCLIILEHYKISFDSSDRKRQKVLIW